MSSIEVVKILAKHLIHPKPNNIELIIIKRKQTGTSYAPLPPGINKPLSKREAKIIDKELGALAKNFISALNYVKQSPDTRRSLWYDVMIESLTILKPWDSNDNLEFEVRQKVCDRTIMDLLKLCDQQRLY